jgi:hypothetical protein
MVSRHQAMLEVRMGLQGGEELLWKRIVQLVKRLEGQVVWEAQAQVFHDEDYVTMAKGRNEDT